MLSQLTLRVPKKLIERLKNRASTEKASVNALAERLMETGLAGSAAGNEYLQLITDPDEALARLYRQIVLGQMLGTGGISRDSLRFLLELAHSAYARAEPQLVNETRLQLLLDITGELLLWQAGNELPLDHHYLKGTFGLQGEDWRAEWEAFRAGLTPAVTSDYAERLVRPLASDSLNLHTFPDEIITRVFTTPRLQALFPLFMYARQWSSDRQRQFAEQVRPFVPALRQSIDTGSVKFDIEIHGQEPGTRTGSWYQTPQLFLIVTGQEFIMPLGYEPFCELLRTLSVWQRHPEALRLGWRGNAVMFSLRETASQHVVVGLDALRLFLPEEGFTTLTKELVTRSNEGELGDALSALACLYGDL